MPHTPSTGPEPRRVPAPAALLLACLAAAAACLPAQAQTPEQQAVRAYDIPAGPLDRALNALAKQAGIVLAADGSLTAGKQSPGVRGTYTLEGALRRLLAGTGLGYRFTGSGTVALVSSAGQGEEGPLQLGAITVEAAGETGYRVEVPASRRLGVPLEDIPQGVSVISEAVIEDQRPDDVNELILNNSSVQPGDEFFARPVVRGFEATQLNEGVAQPLFNNNSRFNETVNVERVEILKGPATILYGSLRPGGTVNRIIKRPQAERSAAIDLAGATGVDDQALVEGTVDLTGALDADARWRGRLIGLARHRDSFRDFVEIDRFFVQPSLSFEPTPDTSIVLRGFYEEEDGFLDDGLPTLASGDIAPLDFTANRQEPGDSIVFENAGVRAIVDQRLTEFLSFSAQAFYERHEEDRESTRFFGDVQPDGRTLNRTFLEQFSTRDLYGVQSDVTVDLATGPVRHDFRVGVDYRVDEAENTARFAFAPSIDILDPQFGQPVTGPFFPDFRARTVESFGAFVQERVYLFQDRVILVGGARYDRADLESEGVGAFAQPDLDFTQDEVSPRAGIVVKPLRRLSLYASYSESFEATDPNAGLLNPGEFTEPELGEQWEAGVRVELIPERASARLAFFEITKENVQTADPDDPNRTVQIGEQESRGVELEVEGELLPGLEVLASGTYNDTEITRDTTGRRGNQLPNAPEWAGSVAAQYHFPRGGRLGGLSVGGAVFVRGDRFADIDNDTALDSYARVDANISYRWKAIVASLNVRNLFDADYIQTNTIPGPPLTVEGRIGLRF